MTDKGGSLSGSRLSELEEHILESGLSQSSSSPSISDRSERRGCSHGGKPWSNGSFGSVNELDITVDHISSSLGSTGYRQRNFSLPRGRQEDMPRELLCSPLSPTNRSQSDLEQLKTPLGRRQWTQRQVEDRRKEYISLREISLFAGTWNVCGNRPSQDLSDWLFCDGKEYDLYFLGLQEVQPLSGMSAMSTDPARGKWWTSHIKKTLRAQGDYVLVCARQMVGIMLLVFVRAEHEPSLQKVMTSEAGTGFMNQGGNKGAVAVRFQLFESTFCFVSAHFAAQQDNVPRRNQDYREVVRKMSFGDDMSSSTLSFLLSSFGGTALRIHQHDLILWLGDLNYRIDMEPSATLEAINRQDWATLLEHDQLKKAIHTENDLFHGFIEHGLTFAPTYKCEKAVDGYELDEDGKPRRCPAWTDRILWKTGPAKRDADSVRFQAECTDYRRHEILGSDHRPVSAQFWTRVPCLDGLNRSRVLSDVYDQLQPDVVVQPPHIRLPLLRLGLAAKDFFFVENHGLVPVGCDLQGIPSWLEVTPLKLEIPAGRRQEFQITFALSGSEDAKLRERTTNRCETVSLEASLKVIIQDGPVIDLSVQGSYMCCILGVPLRSLLTTEEEPTTTVPRPISMLCDALERPKTNIFDGSASSLRVGQLLEEISNGRPIPDTEEGNVISECLLEIINCLGPVVPPEYLDAFAVAGASRMDNVVGNAFALLDACNRALLKRVAASIRKALLQEDESAFIALAEVVFAFPADSDGMWREDTFPNLLNCLRILANTGIGHEEDLPMVCEADDVFGKIDQRSAFPTSATAGVGETDTSARVGAVEDTILTVITGEVTDTRKTTRVWPETIAIAEEQRGMTAIAKEEASVIAEKQRGMTAVAEEHREMTAIADEETGMTAIADEETGMTAIAEEETGMTAIAVEETGMTAIAEEETGVTAIADEETGMTAIAEGETRMTAVVEEEIGMTAIAEEETGMTAIMEEETGMTAIAEEQTEAMPEMEKQTETTSIAGEHPEMLLVAPAQREAMTLEEDRTALSLTGELTDLKTTSDEQTEMMAIGKSFADTKVITEELPDRITISREQTETMASTKKLPTLSISEDQTYAKRTEDERATTMAIAEELTSTVIVEERTDSVAIMREQKETTAIPEEWTDATAIAIEQMGSTATAIEQMRSTPPTG